MKTKIIKLAGFNTFRIFLQQGEEMWMIEDSETGHRAVTTMQRTLKALGQEPELHEPVLSLLAEEGDRLDREFSSWLATQFRSPKPGEPKSLAMPVRIPPEPAQLIHRIVEAWNNWERPKR